MYKVIWQLGKEAADLELAAGSGSERAGSSAGLLDDVETIGPAEPVFSAPAPRLRRNQMSLSPEAREDPAYDLASYYHVFVRTWDEAEQVRERLQNTKGVIYCEVQGEPSPPVVFSNRDVSEEAAAAPEGFGIEAEVSRNFVDMQRYLLSAARDGGVDAAFAWGVPGGRGAGVTLVDIEAGWEFLHEDLRADLGGLIGGQPLADPRFIDHGTAILGIVGGDRNGFGVTGIAHESFNKTFAATFGNGRWNVADAILRTGASLQPGDVILIELQNSGPAGGALIPIEYWRSEHVAIRTVIENRGIVVVEAAANGFQDLDLPVYGGLLSRQSADSGAILVGAGSSGHSQPPFSRLSFSNFGSRLDVQGWGEAVVTCGGRSSPQYCDLTPAADRLQCYTGNFGGTSSASAMVAATSACVNGALKAAGRRPLPGPLMRRLFVETGTPQVDGPAGSSSQWIGPLPDLRRAFQRLGLAAP